jgi:hypothetical protein
VVLQISQVGGPYGKDVAKGIMIDLQMTLYWTTQHYLVVNEHKFTKVVQKLKNASDSFIESLVRYPFFHLSFERQIK